MAETGIIPVWLQTALEIVYRHALSRPAFFTFKTIYIIIGGRYI